MWVNPIRNNINKTQQIKTFTIAFHLVAKNTIKQLIKKKDAFKSGEQL